MGNMTSTYPDPLIRRSYADDRYQLSVGLTQQEIDSYLQYLQTIQTKLDTILQKIDIQYPIQPLPTMSPPPSNFNQTSPIFYQPLSTDVPFPIPSNVKYETFQEKTSFQAPDGTFQTFDLPPSATPGDTCMVGNDSLFSVLSRYQDTPVAMPDMTYESCYNYGSSNKPILSSDDCPPGFVFTEDCRYFSDTRYPTGERKFPACVYKGPMKNSTNKGMCVTNQFGNYFVIDL